MFGGNRTSPTGIEAIAPSSSHQITGVVVAMGPEYLPLLPASILYIDLATDGLPNLALGVAPPDPDIMRKSPRNPRESVFSKAMRTLIVMALLIECPIFLWMFFYSQPDMELARTRGFFMFLLVELIIAINVRSLRYGLIQAPPHKWLLLAIAWELLLIAGLIQLPAVRDAFGISMLSASDLRIIVAFNVVVVIAIEIAKFVFRRNDCLNKLAYLDFSGARWSQTGSTPDGHGVAKAGKLLARWQQHGKGRELWAHGL